MSWFDATGFANLAKSALKEAQKTIDKALDIKDEEQKIVQQMHAEETSDFFASWGLKNEDGTNEVDNDIQKRQNTGSIWGSFTGSFFETPKNTEENTWKTVKHSKSLQGTTAESQQQCELVSSISFSDKLVEKDVKSVNTEEESRAANESVNIHHDSSDNRISKESNDKSTSESCTSSEHSSIDNIDSNSENDISKSVSLNSEHVYHVSTMENSDSITSGNEENKRQCNKLLSDNSDTNQISSTNVFHKVSTTSSENDKKSLESVEILGSQSNTDCTTTPDSDLNSAANSTSPSVVGIKINSESVEVLPDSLVTSPSSVEILGDWKSDSSPYLSPIDPKNSVLSSILDGNECVTLSREDSDILQSANKNNFMQLSSSDISPYESPMEEVKALNTNSYPYNIDCTPPNAFSTLDSNKSLLNVNSSKISPESVEVIMDADDLDEASLAEDSYTSASEGTVMTILESFQQSDTIKNKTELSDMNMKTSGKMYDSYLDDKQTLGKVSMETKLNLNLDPLKEKHSLHLTIEPITTQPIRKIDHLDSVNEKTDVTTFSQLMNTTIEPPDPDSYLQVEDTQETKIEGNTEQCLIATDSSGEGTLIESSSEDNATLVCTSDSKVLETPLTASSYVKTMLADAMVEKGEIIDIETHCTGIPRENSPISSERY